MATKKRTQEQNSAYTPYLFEAIYNDSLKRGYERSQEYYKSRQSEQNAFSLKHFGKETRSTVSPSIASQCLRWYGYNVLGEELHLKPVTPRVTAIEAMKFGTAAHRDTLRDIAASLRGTQEAVIDEDPLGGRIDYLFKNPLTDEYQILDLKFVSRFVFKKITREGLPEALKAEKRLYKPAPEHRLQVIQYMWAKRQEGKPVTFGLLFYINRDNFAKKEALIPWDVEAEHDMNVFLEKAKTAQEAIANKQLPERSAEASYICERICPWRLYCEPGKKFAAEGVKKEQKPKLTAGMRIMLRQQRQEDIEKANALGITQPVMPGMETAIKRKR